MKSKIFGILAVAILAVPEVHAGAIVSLESVVATNNNPSGYAWNYAATFASTDGMSGAYFTLYDWNADVLTIEPALDWHVNQDLMGITPAGLNPADDPAIRNITFTFVGSRTGTTFRFTIVSSVNTSVIDDYAWYDLNAYPVATAGQSGLGSVAVASRTGTTPGGNAVPEPGTLALLGLGLAGLALSRKRKTA